MKSAYAKMQCPYCGAIISVSGGGVMHYRKHVREGLLREIPRDWRRKNPRIRFEFATYRGGVK